MTISAQRARELLDYDPASGVFCWAVDRTGKAKAGTIAGRLDSKGYRQISVDNRRYGAHRLVWLWTHGEWPEDEVDHINGSRDDNRISNLRLVSRAENMRNKKRYRTAKSKKAGVTSNKCGTWNATIGRGGYIGTFKTFDEALAARTVAEARLGYHENHGRV